MSDSNDLNETKILITATTFPLDKNDSQPRFILNLAQSLQKYFNVQVLVPRGDGAVKKEVFEGVKVERFAYFFKSLESLVYGGGILENLKKSKLNYLQVPFLFLAQFISLCRVIKRDKISIVNAHWIVPQGVIAIITKKLFFKQLKVVVTSHGADLFSLRSNLLTKLKKWVIESSDCFIVVSEAMKEFCYEEVGVCKSKNILVRSMGVDLSSKFTIQKPLEQREGIIFVGRLAEKKGLHVLIDAIALLKTNYPDISLTVVGDGPEKESLIKRSQKLKVDTNIKFLGSRQNQEIPALLNQHKIFVMPSIVAKSGDQEGLGLVAVEALGCGCAVIASDLPAVRDVITDNENGYLFETGNEKSLVQKLELLLTDDKEVTRFVKTGTATAKMKFDWQNVGKDYSHYLSRIVN
ncbi:MAG: glycosyltransferase [Gammaproteobacteria bacterium]|nr:glycosyltransferase [Gammaproteobacteria bacterium]